MTAKKNEFDAFVMTGSPDMSLTEQQKEIALRVLQDILPGRGTMIVSNDDFLEFAARFLAALPKPEPVAWTTKGQIAAMENGFQHYIQGRVPRFVQPCTDDVPLYTTPPQPDDVRNAERYRWLRDSENQVTEDDPCVSDSFFNSWFGEELDKVIDEMIARNAAIAAAKGEV